MWVWEPSADIDLTGILIWRWSKRKLLHEDKKARSLEVLVSRMWEYNGETSTYCV